MLAPEFIIVAAVVLVLTWAWSAAGFFRLAPADRPFRLPSIFLWDSNDGGGSSAEGNTDGSPGGSSSGQGADGPSGEDNGGGGNDYSGGYDMSNVGLEAAGEGHGTAAAGGGDNFSTIGWGIGQIPPAPVAEDPSTLSPVPSIGPAQEVGTITNVSAPSGPAGNPFSNADASGYYDFGLREDDVTDYQQALRDLSAKTPGTFAYADKAAREGWFTPETGILGFRERAQYDPKTNTFEPGIEWDPAGAVVDVISSVVSFALGGPIGTAVGIGVNRVGNSILANNNQALGPFAGGTVPAFDDVQNEDRASGGYAGPGLASGWGGGNGGAGSDTLTSGAETGAGGFDLSDDTKAAPAGGGEAAAPASHWPVLLMAAAGAIEIFS